MICVSNVFVSLVKIGTLESLSPKNMVFSSVLKINGTIATIEPGNLISILNQTDPCSIPKLVPGRTYFFTDENFITGFNHDSFLETLHFIMSKCFRRPNSSV